MTKCRRTLEGSAWAAVWLLIVCGAYGMNWAKWSDETQVPEWMISTLCEQSDRVEAGVMLHDRDTACSEASVHIRVYVNSTKDDFDGIRDVLYQVSQLYANCAAPTVAKTKFSVQGAENLSPFVKFGLDQIVKHSKATYKEPKCFTHTYTLTGAEANPIEWLFTANRGARLPKTDFMADGAFKVRHPALVQNFGVEALREFVSGSTNAWRSQDKKVLYVPSKSVHEQATLVKALEAATTKGGGSFEISKATSAIELCQEMTSASVVVLPDWRLAAPTICMRSGSQLIASSSESEVSTMKWMFLVILNRLKLRLYHHKHTQKPDGLIAPNTATIAERIARNLEDSMWSEDQIEFMKHPHP